MTRENGFLHWITQKRRATAIIIAAVLLGLLLLLLPSLGTSGGADADSCDIEELCSSIDGVGECKILLSYSEDGEDVVAVAVICEGGDRLEIRHRLTELLSSLYGIGYNRISVEKLR